MKRGEVLVHCPFIRKSYDRTIRREMAREQGVPQSLVRANKQQPVKDDYPTNPIFKTTDNLRLV